MNNVNMVNMNPLIGGPVGTAIPMMNNGIVGGPSAPRPQQQQQIAETNKHLLNTYIYEYFLRNEMVGCARALLMEDPQMKLQDGPNTRRDENGNILGNGIAESMDADSKDGIEAKDLPQPMIANLSVDQPFLFEWFCLFWDMFNAQKGKSGNGQVNAYMNHTQNQSRMRQNQQQELLRQMRPDITHQQQVQMMQMQRNGMGMMKPGNNLPRTAMANSHNNPGMMQHMLQQQQKQGQMQRDHSDMDGNRVRPASPGSAENAPSPSKRPRLDGPFNPVQGSMVPNGRPAGQGMPGPSQQVGSGPSQQAEQLLLQSGINPSSLNPEQFATFQNQTPAVQQKTIQTYAANLQQQQQQQMGKPMPNANGPPGQGSPMVPQTPDGPSINSFYNTEAMGGPGAMRGPSGPNATQQAGGSNHALQDYQMQLMLLEQQNKKRLMMARQEQDGSNSMQMPRDGPGGPGGPGGAPGPPGSNVAFQGTSPQAGRPGASPNPADMKRGPQQMNPATMGSPLPEGVQSRGSPSAINFMAGNQMDPNATPHFIGTGGNMGAGPQMNSMRPPSSHPGQPPFTGPLNPQQQQMMAARQQGQLAGQAGQQMQWQQQQGGPGGPNGNPMVSQGQTPQQVHGTPQPRNAAMPPPAQPAAAAAAAAAANARNTSSPQVSSAAPPTPSQTHKANPKKKETKSAKDKRTAAQKKANTTLNAAGATPVAEPAAEPEAPTPATPITPINAQQNINRPGPGPSNGPPQAISNGQGPPPVPQQAAAPMVPPVDPNQNQAFDINIPEFGLEFANPLNTNDVLNDFDFDSFLHDNEGDTAAFDFSAAAATFMDPEIET